MDYETASDFEINKRLAEWLDCDFHCDGEVLFVSKKHDGNNILSVSGCVNFCLNWNDIMPIAIDLNVSFEPTFEGAYVASQVLKYNFDGSVQSYDFQSLDKSPQRAITICCIKALEC